MIIGTPLFMSPEQARGELLDCRADLFSLGSVLYAMTTGSSPFRANNTLATLKRVNEDTPQSIQELAPETPRWLCDIITKLLAKNPAERFASAREVADTLAACEANGVKHPVAELVRVRTNESEAADLNRPGTEVSRFRRQRARVTVAAALAGVLVLGAIVLALQIPNGEVIVEVPDDLSAEERKQIKIKIEVDGNGNARVADEANGWTIGVKAGKYDVQLMGGADVVQIKDKQVTVTRGKKGIVKLTLRPSGSAVATISVKTATPNANAYNWPADAPKPALAPFDAAQARQHQEAWAKHLGLPVEYTNSIGMKFVLIPPGEFLMGSTHAEIDEAHRVANYTKMWQKHIKCETPRHNVILTQPIYLGAHEVTQKNYTAVMGKNPSRFSNTGPSKETVANLDTQNHPVETVSWNDAAEFCAKLSQTEDLKPFSLRTGETVAPLAGTGYRLPTEAEWEFACRAGSTTQFWVGERDEDLARAAWFSTNSGEHSHAVGGLQSNSWGLFDILGNVWEWVQDGWDQTYSEQFASHPAINPAAPSLGPLCVIRGGDSSGPATFCRSTFRGVYAPSSAVFSIGFRAALTVDAVKESLKRR